TKKVIACLFLAGAVACVSRTVPEGRFTESATLSAPAFNVSVADPGTFTFAAVGDLHIGGGDTQRLGRILDGAEADGDAFLVLLGDQVDKGVRSAFEALRNRLQDRGWWDKTLFTVGNHDVFEDGWENYRDVLGPSYLSVDVG